jgi:hypothetical protein
MHVRRRFLASLVVVATGAGLYVAVANPFAGAQSTGLPPPSHIFGASPNAPETYVGDIPRRANEVVPDQLSITIRAKRIVAFSFPAWLLCADGSPLGVSFDNVQQKVGPIALSDDHFSFSAGDPVAGNGLTIRASGAVTAGSTVVGAVHIAAQEDGGIRPSGPHCSERYNYVAALPWFAQEQFEIALRDLSREGPFHETETATFGGHDVSSTDDVARTEGQQWITIRGEGTASVRVVSDEAYVYSPQQAVLTRFFGLPPRVAERAHGHWLDVPHFSTTFPTVAGGSTVASVIGLLLSIQPLSVTLPTERDGQHVVGVNGWQTTPRTNYMTLYVSNNKKRLPVSLAVRRYNGNATYRFSNWGEHISIKAPSKAVSLERLLGNN